VTVFYNFYDDFMTVMLAAILTARHSAQIVYLNTRQRGKYR